MAHLLYLPTPYRIVRARKDRSRYDPRNHVEEGCHRENWRADLVAT